MQPRLSLLSTHSLWCPRRADGAIAGQVIDHVTFDDDNRISAARMFGADALLAKHAECAAKAASGGAREEL